MTAAVFQLEIRICLRILYTGHLFFARERLRRKNPNWPIFPTCRPLQTITADGDLTSPGIAAEDPFRRFFLTPVSSTVIDGRIPRRAGSVPVVSNRQHPVGDLA